MNWLGRLFVSFLAILVLLALGLLALAVTFDPNDHRERIARALSGHLGQPVRIEGELALEVYPWLGVTSGRVRLDNPPGFSDNPMLQADGLEARAALLPLLRGEIVLDTIVLRAPRLRLELDGRGGHNWSPLIGHLTGDAASGQSPPDQPAASTRPRELALAGIEIRDGRVLVVDPIRERQVELDDIQLAIGALQPGLPVDFRLDGRLEADAPQLSATMMLSGQLLQDEEALLLISPRFRAEGRATAPLPERFEIALESEFAQTLPDSGSYLVADSRMEVSASALPWLSYLDLDLDTRMTGNWRAGRHRLEGLQAGVLMRGLPIRSGELAMDIETGIAVDLPNGTARLPDLVMRSDPVVLRGQFDIAGLLEPGRWRLGGPMRLDPFSPKALARTLNQPVPKMRDETALEHFALSGYLDADAHRVSLSEARLELDDQLLKGELGLGGSSLRHIRVALSTPLLDLDRYLPAGEDDPSPEPLAGAHRMPRGLGGSRAERTDQPVPLPVALLRSLDTEIRLSADVIRIFDQQLENLTVVFRGRDGELAFDRLDFNAYRGLVRSQSHLDLRAQVPGWRLAMDARHVSLGPMLEAWLLEDRLGGVADLTLDLETTGQRPSAMKAGLDGHLEFSVADGHVEGIDLDGHIEGLRNPENTPRTPALRHETRIGSLSGTARIRNGLLQSDALSGVLDDLPVRGRGEIDLARDRLDYQLEIAAPDGTFEHADRLLLKGRLAHPLVTTEPRQPPQPDNTRLPAL
ncbi:MAG: AsmA family protein [Halothiobacillaceae bacterium]